MDLKITLLENKLCEDKTFQCLKKDNRRIEKKKLLEDNEKLSNKILKLEKKLKSLESSEVETNNDDSLILDLESEVNALNERNKVLNIICA